MTTVRVTQGLMVRQALNDLNRQTRRLLQLQQQLSTGLKVNSPSDDPLAARRAVNIRSLIGQNEQYLTNLSNATPQVSETASTLQTVITSLQRAYELTVQGANGTNSQTQLNNIAIEIDQILESTLSEANHQTNGRYIFGGTRTLDAPFVAARDANGTITSVTYQGNDESIRVLVGDGVEASINEPGNRAFTDGQDYFQLLISIRDELRAGNQGALQNQRLGEMITAQNQLLVSVARVGTIENQFERLTRNMEDYVQQLQGTLSDNIDADYAETVINLQAQTNAFQAALNATARVIQPSLLDYIG